nr:MAG TPA: hypothetical protein [Caudoviricetes sp.]
MFRGEQFEIKEIRCASLLVEAFQVDHSVPDVRHNDAERKVVRARGNSLFAARDRLADVSGSNLLHGLRSLISAVKLLWLLVVVFHCFTSFLHPLSHKKRGLTHRLALNNPSIIHHSIAAAILSLIARIRRSTFSVPYSSVSVCMAKEICKTLMPFARRRKIFNSSSVKPQSRSNCSRSSRGNCSLIFVPGVVKLRRRLSVVIGYTLHVCFKKCLCEAFRRLDAIDAAERFYGFFHLSVVSVYKALNFPSGGVELVVHFLNGSFEENFQLVFRGLDAFLVEHGGSNGHGTGELLVTVDILIHLFNVRNGSCRYLALGIGVDVLFVQLRGVRRGNAADGEDDVLDDFHAVGGDNLVHCKFSLLQKIVFLEMPGVDAVKMLDGVCGAVVFV